MKKLLLLCTVLIGLASTAQVTVTTMTASYCGWNEDTKKFDVDCSFTAEHSARIAFNKAETMFVHTTAAITSTYYVNYIDHQLEEDRDLYVYHVTSDVGNDYVYYVDVKYNELRVMAGDGSYLLMYRIKSVF